MLRFLFALTYAALIVIVSIAVYINGWGMAPKNWGWIAFGSLFMVLPILIPSLIGLLAPRR